LFGGTLFISFLALSLDATFHSRWRSHDFPPEQEPLHGANLHSAEQGVEITPVLEVLTMRTRSLADVVRAPRPVSVEFQPTPPEPKAEGVVAVMFRENQGVLNVLFL